MKIIQRTVGLTLVLLPFAISIGAMWAQGGLQLVAGVVGTVVVLTACIFGGLFLIDLAE